MKTKKQYKKNKWIPCPHKCYVSNNWRKLHGYPLSRKGHFSCVEVNGMNKCGLPFC